MDYSTLNVEQQEAVFSDANKILCLAGAGTGKTHCMLSRITRLVEEGVHPHNILVLTFTNAAAFEMRDRYIRSSNASPYVPEFRTFHSFCYALLSNNVAIRRRLGFSRVPLIATDADTQKIMRTAMQQCGVRLSDAKLSGKTPRTPQEQFEYDIVKKSSAKLMKQENLITFDSLCYDICKLFVDDDPLVEWIKKRHTYIFVDEFQDTDERQYQFISSFRDAKLFVVGDALQAIYAFRGADSSIIKKLADDPEWKTVKLFRNYRSTKQICEFANKHSTHALDSYRVTIDSDKMGPAPSVTPMSFRHDVDFPLSKIIEVCIRTMKELGGTNAILARTNAEVDDIKGCLSDAGISYKSNSTDDFPIHILRCMTDNQYAIRWLATFLNTQQYSEYIRDEALTVANDQDYTLTQFADSFSTNLTVSNLIDLIRKIRRVLRSDQPAITKCSTVFEWLGKENHLVDTDATEPIDLINYMLSVFDAPDDTSTDLYVGTVHSVKGLEYDNVFLLGVDGKSFRLTNEENRNLYYVGITRAKTHLYVWEGA